MDPILKMLTTRHSNSTKRVVHVLSPTSALYCGGSLDMGGTFINAGNIEAVNRYINEGCLCDACVSHPEFAGVLLVAAARARHEPQRRQPQQPTFVMPRRRRVSGRGA